MKKSVTVTQKPVIQVKKWGINGEGIGYFMKKPAFIENAIPGETVEAVITEAKDRYFKGRTKKVLERSSKRREPICRHWESCGGCALMHVQYKEQAAMKQKLLAEALKKYAGYTGPILPIIKNPNPLGYRNTLKMPLAMHDGKIESGMYAASSHDFVPIDKCIIHSKKLEFARMAVMKVLQKFNCQAVSPSNPDGYRSLVMREFDGKIMVVLVTGDILVEQKLADDLMHVENVVSVWQSVKSEDDPVQDIFGSDMYPLAGQEFLEADLNGLKLRISPKAFFQLNTEQSIGLYTIAQNMIPECDILCEAYSGIGAISLMAHNKAEEVIGIESNEDAVNDANDNARLNDIENVKFLCGDAGEVLNQLEKTMNINVLIADPPRSGLMDNMRTAILKSKIETFVYISCNPSTLAKDLNDLEKAYKIETIQPVDMFSQTPHIESICLLTPARGKTKTFEKKGPSKDIQKPKKDLNPYEKALMELKRSKKNKKK